jgi:hypothetical protein
MSSEKRPGRCRGQLQSHANVGVALEITQTTVPAGPRGVLEPRWPDAKRFEDAWLLADSLQRNKSAQQGRKQR